MGANYPRRRVGFRRTWNCAAELSATSLASFGDVWLAFLVHGDTGSGYNGNDYYQATIM